MFSRVPDGVALFRRTGNLGRLLVGKHSEVIRIELSHCRVGRDEEVRRLGKCWRVRP
jgi:hypothetical protein